tara:strand:- start:1123 stop:1647 length:525 start_codon:yes stop_codon:yes gene_type:complete
MAANNTGKSLIISSFFSGFASFLQYIHEHVLYLNNSKFFAGIAMIMLNIGSKFIPIQFSHSTEEYIKMVVSKQLLIFAMAWMGTRDIYTALVLVAVFTILSDFALNDESPYCIVPEKYKVLAKILAKTVDSNDDCIVTDEEVSEAIGTLKKAKLQKKRVNDRKNLAQFQTHFSG